MAKEVNREVPFLRNQVIRDPCIKHTEVYLVVFNGRVCSRNFFSRSNALTHLDLLETGKRQPEYYQP